MEYLTLDNGSGLSRDEHITRALARRSVAGGQREPGRAGVRRLAAGGGRRRHDAQPADQRSRCGGNAHIKTGTLRDVRAIAGYVASADGDSYVVVSIINDPHAEAARAAHDALLEWVYQGPSQPMHEVPTA